MTCKWEEIDDFRSLSEFNRFVGWIEERVYAGDATEVPVENRYAGEMISERWFVCADCQSKWRLVYPDPGYFSGLFCLVKRSE